LHVERHGLDHILQRLLPLEDVEQVVRVAELGEQVAQDGESDVEDVLVEVGVGDDALHVDPVVHQPRARVRELWGAVDVLGVHDELVAEGAFQEQDLFLLLLVCLQGRLVVDGVQIAGDFGVIHPAGLVLAALLFAIAHDQFVPLLVGDEFGFGLEPDEE